MGRVMARARCTKERERISPSVRMLLGMKAGKRPLDAFIASLT